MVHWMYIYIYIYTCIYIYIYAPLDYYALLCNDFMHLHFSDTNSIKLPVMAWIFPDNPSRHFYGLSDVWGWIHVAQRGGCTLSAMAYASLMAGHRPSAEAILRSYESIQKVKCRPKVLDPGQGKAQMLHFHLADVKSQSQPCRSLLRGYLNTKWNTWERSASIDSKGQRCHPIIPQRCFFSNFCWELTFVAHFPAFCADPFLRSSQEVNRVNCSWEPLSRRLDFL